MPLACRIQWSWVDRTGDTVKQSQRRVTSPTSKMFRQHLKCSLTAPSHAGTSFGFFLCFVLLSQLSEPGRLGTALSGPTSRFASAMIFSGCDTSPTVDCCLFSICRTQSPEELGRVGERSLQWTARLPCGGTDFFLMLTRRRGLWERGEKFSAGGTSTTMHAEERQHECSQRHSEVRAGRLSSHEPFQAQKVSHRTDKTSLESKRTPRHFPIRLFLYQLPSAAPRTAPNGVKERASFCLVFRSLNTTSSHRMFSRATEGPNLPKETLTFKKNFFSKQLRDHYPRALSKSSIIRQMWWNVKRTSHHEL